MSVGVCVCVYVGVCALTVCPVQWSYRCAHPSLTCSASHPLPCWHLCDTHTHTHTHTHTTHNNLSHPSPLRLALYPVLCMAACVRVCMPTHAHTCKALCECVCLRTHAFSAVYGSHQEVRVQHSLRSESLYVTEQTCTHTYTHAHTHTHTHVYLLCALEECPISGINRMWL